MEQTGGKRRKGSEREDADEGTRREKIGKGEQEQDGRGKNANL